MEPTYSEPFEVTTTNSQVMEIPVFDNHFFVELSILSRKVDYQKVEEYGIEMEQYEQEYQEYMEEKESLAISVDRPIKPQFPKEKIVYRNIKVNLFDKVFTTWSSDWDEGIDHEVVIVEYYIKGAPSSLDQYNIKMTEKEWVGLLTKYGAVIN